MGSDGESDPPSGTSSEEVASPVRLRLRQHPARPGSSEVGGGPGGFWGVLGFFRMVMGGVGGLLGGFRVVLGG